MLHIDWRKWLCIRTRSRPRRRRTCRPTFDCLEERTTPATHIWSGAAGNLMSQNANWSSGGHPSNAEDSPVVLVFPKTTTAYYVTDDIVNLNVDQIQFTGSPSAYVLNGTGVTMHLTGAAA